MALAWFVPLQQTQIWGLLSHFKSKFKVSVFVFVGFLGFFSGREKEELNEVYSDFVSQPMSL